MNDHHPVVSSDAEEIILVNDNDDDIGFAAKGPTHDGLGVLHRAFSLFIFTSDGRLILQQRSATKRLWPGYWANSVCSHPRRGETIEVATARRLEQELGMTSELTFAFKFQYHAQYHDLGSERELCHVFVGVSDAEVRPNVNELDAWRYVTIDELTAEIAAHPERFTPWLQIEWPQLVAWLDENPDVLRAL